ncbi:zinc finger protein, partial [Aphelenchoides avenae]
MDIAGGTLDHCRWMMEEGTWCAFPAHKKSLLKRHMARHSGNKACACPTCGQLFANNTKLLGHMLRKQEADPELTCNFCHRSFPTFAMLREHCRRHVRKVRCPQCALALENTTDLRRHLSTVHEKNREQECSVCHKSFTQRSDLRKHMAVHKDALEFVCGDCGQAFRWRKQLAEHERTHKE